MSLPRAQRGFTLVEVMVSITILSLVMVVLVSGLRTLGDTQVSIERVVDRVDEIRGVSSFLRENLETAVVGGSSDGLALGGGATETTFFRIRGNSLEWKSRVLFGENYGGSHFMRVAPENGTLVLRWQDPGNQQEPGDWSEAPYRVLLASLDTFKVSIREGFGEEWITPNNYRNPPQLVRLEIQSQGRFWPDLIIPVQR